MNKGNVIGDKRTHNARNIKFFWSSEKYLKENVYHCLSTSFILAFTLIIIVFILFVSIRNENIGDNLRKTPPWIFFFSVPCFVFLLGFIICRINESKIKKIRIGDLNSKLGRTITVDKSSK
ncbi:MAG: hypothetical protein LBB39_00760 [Mycoplasmataceae bacterium]|nr:hypothetical protein [Mycoplasmataceae bacterium]